MNECDCALNRRDVPDVWDRFVVPLRAVRSSSNQTIAFPKRRMMRMGVW